MAAGAGGTENMRGRRIDTFRPSKGVSLKEPQNRLILVVLDGFGIGTDPSVSAIAKARTPFLDSLFKQFPSTTLNASSEDVGLPEGQMGNSEVGHMNIGAGRVVYQDITRINRSIRSGDFFKNPALIGAVGHAKQKSSALHLIGLFSDGGVHSHLNHLYALLELSTRYGLQSVYLHALTDGRDTPPEAGVRYLRQFAKKSNEVGCGAIATIVGRYYAMDRDSRWDRTEKAYRAMTEGKGTLSEDPVRAVEESYREGVTDEFIKPVVIQRNGKPVATIQDRDAVIFYNFRADRTRQLTRALIMGEFGHFSRRKLDIHFVSMTKYHDDFPVPVAFPPTHLTNTLGEIVSNLGWKQLRIAETEKYAHVTFFFGGGRETPFPGEDRVLVPSPRGVATYDQKPEMSAPEVTDRVVEQIENKKYEFIVLNYANADMVGHSGNMAATVRAVEVLDECLRRVVAAARGKGYVVLITADHGNADKMVDDDGGPHTAHTTNLVPFLFIKEDYHGGLKQEGRLADIAPTVLGLMGIDVPAEMEGSSLLLSVELAQGLTKAEQPYDSRRS